MEPFQGMGFFVQIIYVGEKTVLFETSDLKTSLRQFKANA
jgi:hypothetical protein